MSKKFIQWNLDKTTPGESLPAPLYLFLEERYVQYRAEGQNIDRLIYDRMEAKGFHFFYILETDLKIFEAWAAQHAEAPRSTLVAVRNEARRQVKDIFHSFHADESVSQVLETSVHLVDELTSSPLAVQSLTELQTLSRSTADHSVNVSILSVYLALNLGYSHMVILRHLASGALLHDIGKIEAIRAREESGQGYEEKLREHPLLGEAILAKNPNVSQEVRMIVAQHHEYHDGSGYPRGLHGNQIYDLARIVAIANTFDSLVSDGKGPLAERQVKALAELSGPLASRFHPAKLNKIVKILSLGV